MKRCRKCGQVKALEDFYKAAGMTDGRRHDCKACNAAASAERHRLNPEPAIERARLWRHEHPERYAAQKERWRQSGRKKIVDRRSYLKRTYGITPEDYDHMLDDQEGRCAICGRLPRDDISFHVDHDHATGEIRGLLCFRCNNALGDLEDDIDRLRQALRYVDRPEAEVLELTRQRARALVTTA